MTRLRQRDVTREYAVKIVVENYLHKSNQQTKYLTPMHKNEWRILKPIGCLLLAPSVE
jgi:hypothetical protein